MAGKHTKQLRRCSKHDVDGDDSDADGDDGDVSATIPFTIACKYSYEIIKVVADIELIFSNCRAYNRSLS